MRHLRIVVLPLALVALSGAWRVDSPSGSGRVGADEGRRTGSVQMIVELDLPRQVKLGERVPMTLRVRNEGTETAALALTGRPIAYDLVVQRPNGTEVWSRLKGETVTMILQVRILQPGEALEFEHEWDQRDNAGRAVTVGAYAVHGALTGEDGTLRSEARRLVIAE